MPEKVSGINNTLGFHQPLEVLLEISVSPQLRYVVGYIRSSIVVFPQIKIPVVHVRFPRPRGHEWCHVIVHIPNPRHVLCLEGGSAVDAPRGHVLDHAEDSLPVRERDGGFVDLRHPAPVRGEYHERGVLLQHTVPQPLQAFCWNGVISFDEVGFGLEEVLEQRLPFQEIFRREGRRETEDGVHHAFNPARLVAVLFR
ncbi:unnamed protein product [Cuscuta epithymum]|uniref:Uncharacterized protein n=1 Tax=Cuscuta epithymum TaxID=186058 RepID=A0AAV0BY52_9ASTE|nr:unnamed protein product [Cuscuta epithymum]